MKKYFLVPIWSQWNSCNKRNISGNNLKNKREYLFMGYTSCTKEERVQQN